GKPPIRFAHPQRCTSVECCVCYKSRKFETLFASLTRSTNFFAIFAKIFQPAKALEIFLLSADYAIIIRVTELTAAGGG
ncbi:MAG: hypothetical protein IJ362_00115, partial [Oscillospiraceae bacterium]|nr:hypothetical protein [Oscillospiraceae bacterium]